MLQNRQGRRSFGKFSDQPRRRAQIQNVIVGKLLPVQLLEGLQKRPIKRCFLVWILPITQRLGPPPYQSSRFLQHRLILFRLPREIRPNQMIVVGRMPKNFGGQLLSCGQGRPALPLHLLLHDRIITRVRHHGDRLVILGRTPQHARPADINIFNGLLLRAIRPRHRLLKRIKIHHHQIDRGNLMPSRLLLVGGQISPLQ